MSFYPLELANRNQGHREFPFGNSREFPGIADPQNSRREFPGISRNSELIFLLVKWRIFNYKLFNVNKGALHSNRIRVLPTAE